MSMQVRFRESFLLIVLFMVTGCSFHLDRKDLVGSYKAVYPFGVESLELYDNGSYYQTIKLNTLDSMLENRGHWEVAYYDDPEGTCLQLGHYINVDSGGYQRINLAPAPFTGWPVRVLGKIRIEKSPDNGIALIKH